VGLNKKAVAEAWKVYARNRWPSMNPYHLSLESAAEHFAAGYEAGASFYA
jgi:hypothetical protein